MPRPGTPRATPGRAASGRAERQRPGQGRGDRPQRGPEGQQGRPTARITVVEATPREALERADEAVDGLLEEGREPGDILVLTTGEIHPWQQHELSFGEASYWRQLDERGDVFYASAADARDAARPVVVLAVNGGDETTQAQALVAGLTRAGELLVVCGEQRRLSALIG
ncbi:hypothetical protein [Allostreptomyces psammosilenae]|uniref:Uncharacterized protein n=1 Tax=Allostreptomyces psammosilenae TaxID=1892865 RepID=A0A852ZPC3_9ACTN|nr:hypothetical protein [Allostreptomyces psammosilenae]NYI03110.1 hypothetical protein [Allostreptomyces psammosilenae]